MDHLADHFSRTIARMYFFQAVVLWISALMIAASHDAVGFTGVTTILSNIVGKPHPDAFADYAILVYFAFVLWTWTLFIKRWQIRDEWYCVVQEKDVRPRWETRIDIAFLAPTLRWLPIGVVLRLLFLILLVVTPAIVYTTVYDMVVIEQRLSYRKSVHDEGTLDKRYDPPGEGEEGVSLYSPHTRMTDHLGRELGFLGICTIVGLSVLVREAVDVGRRLKTLSSTWPRWRGIIVACSVAIPLNLVLCAFWMDALRGSKNVNWHVGLGLPLYMEDLLRFLLFAVPPVVFCVAPFLVAKACKEVPQRRAFFLSSCVPVAVCVVFWIASVMFSGMENRASFLIPGVMFCLLFCSGVHWITLSRA